MANTSPSELGSQRMQIVIFRNSKVLSQISNTAKTICMNFLHKVQKIYKMNKYETQFALPFIFFSIWLILLRGPLFPGSRSINTLSGIIPRTEALDCWPAHLLSDLISQSGACSIIGYIEEVSFPVDYEISCSPAYIMKMFASARFQFESVSWLLGKLNDQIHSLASGNVIMEFRYSENGVFLLKLIPNMTILIKIWILLGAKYVAMFISFIHFLPAFFITDTVFRKESDCSLTLFWRVDLRAIRRKIKFPVWCGLSRLETSNDLKWDQFELEQYFHFWIISLAVIFRIEDLNVSPGFVNAFAWS